MVEHTASVLSNTCAVFHWDRVGEGEGEGEGEGVFVLSALILATRPDPLGYLREHAGSGVLSSRPD